MQIGQSSWQESAAASLAVVQGDEQGEVSEHEEVVECTTPTLIMGECSDQECGSDAEDDPPPLEAPPADDIDGEPMDEDALAADAANQELWDKKIVYRKGLLFPETQAQPEDSDDVVMEPMSPISAIQKSSGCRSPSPRSREGHKLLADNVKNSNLHQRVGGEHFEFFESPMHGHLKRVVESVDMCVGLMEFLQKNDPWIMKLLDWFSCKRPYLQWVCFPASFWNLGRRPCRST